MDKRTQAEKDRKKRKAAEIRAAARTSEQKMEQRFDVADRFGGETLEGKPVTDAIFDDARVAGSHAEMLAARGQDPYDPEVEEDPDHCN